MPNDNNLFICSGAWGYSVVAARDAKHARRVYARTWLRRHGLVANREAVLREARAVHVGVQK